MDNNTFAPIIIIPSFEKYEDRALMFSTLINKNGVGRLHFHNRLFSLKPVFPYSCPPKNSPWRKWFETIKTTYEWGRKNKSNIIIHDLFVPRGILVPKMKNTKKVLSLYSDTANYYHGKRYKNDIINKTLLNKIYFHLLYLKRTVFEYVGILLADGIIVNSPEIIEGIKKYYKISRKFFKIINTSVDTDFWKVLNIEREKNIIFYAGRLSTRKGLDVLLNAFYYLTKKNIDLKLIIAGKATKEEDFTWGYKFISENNLSNNIVFLGEIDRNQMREWYNKASVFVLPSNQEGSPRVVKESIACGCPIVCTELPGLINLDPQKKILNFIKPNDIVDLLCGIEHCINHDINYGSIRNYAINNFSPEIIANCTLRFYEDLFLKVDN